MPGDLYHFDLPLELIAQSPASPRDSSRLMVINKTTGELSHHIFRELPQFLKPTDVLVFNNTRVFPARLHGQKSTGGYVEILLLKNIKNSLWEVISHPGIKAGQVLNFPRGVTAAVIDPHHVTLANSQFLPAIGFTPLPPYIHSTATEKDLRRQYQTVYAKHSGSAAAPTAGLHFTQKLLSTLPQPKEYLTLHVGLGTFKPPTSEQITLNRLHSEYFELNSDVAARLNSYKKSGRRIIAVGTTTTRVLESCSSPSGYLTSQTGETDIFIKPPYKFKFVDGLITNFHIPGSSLLMLVSAFASPEIIHRAYQIAIDQKYRFYSFGDATLII
jgi:S-adenosylmethionine:tRNA ribosyltransferase-isomerase